MGFKKLFGVVLVSVLILFANNGVFSRGFNFTYPEIMLTDGGSLPLTEVFVDFDNANFLQAVWRDDVSSIKQIYGTTVFRDGIVLTKFPAMINLTAQDYGFPMIFRNEADYSKMFVFAANQTLFSPNTRIETAYWDLTLLPDPPGVTRTDDAMTGTSVPLDATQYDMVSVGEMVVYAVSVPPDIHLRTFDTVSRTWGAESFVTAGFNEIFSMPRLAKDESRYIYLSYDLYDLGDLQHHLIARRSDLPESVNVWLPEVVVESSYAGSFQAEMAVVGSSLEQRTAFVYSAGSSPMQIFVNAAWGNMWPMDVWPGLPVVATSLPGSVGMLKGPDMAYAPDGSRLYVVWADDRETFNSEVYGVVSFDGGMSFNPVETLTNMDKPIPEAPRVAIGTELGNMAVSFIAADGAGSSPYVLLSVADFLDACDDSPGLFWTSYPGVTVDYGTYFSPPASYRLANESIKGTLLQDYGLIEQTGSVSLLFYDDPSITSADFEAGLENGNAKGVIRMLGVRNDISPSNYSYNSNGTWLDSGIARSLGWHYINFSVDPVQGLTMSIEYSPGASVEWTDSAFTSFTSVTITGGDDTDPYFIDDVQVLALPLENGGTVPLDSFPALLLTMVVFGAILFRFSR